MKNESELVRSSPEDKKNSLFEKQKKLLDTFLEKHAITESQYKKSLCDLKAKMGIPEK